MILNPKTPTSWAREHPETDPTDSTGEPGEPLDSQGAQKALLARVESATYLPSNSDVARKLIELGNDPEAGTQDYDKVISADASLSAKLLALANSSWFGVRHRVTSVRSAIALLGISNVRSLAMSYWISTMHNGTGLSRAESLRFWRAGLCKAITAKHYAKALDSSVAEDSFVAGMLQDLAVTVMYSAAPTWVGYLLEDAQCDGRSQLRRERELFQVDHAEVGQLLGRKLDLPESLIDLIAFHHDLGGLCELNDNETLAEAVYAASLLPHQLNNWNPRDAAGLQALIDNNRPLVDQSVGEFLSGVQSEFDYLYRFFEGGEASSEDLTRLFPS